MNDREALEDLFKQSSLAVKLKEMEAETGLLRTVLFFERCALFLSIILNVWLIARL